MNGFYVNEKAQVFLVSEGDGANNVSVLASNDTVGVAAVSANRTLVVLNGVDGIYNGSDAIRWANGAVWRRVEMSLQQFRVMTTRPYVPLTIVALRLLTECFMRAVTAFMAAGVWKTM